jgi:dsDNA-binding SOS-regulon protein
MVAMAETPGERLARELAKEDENWQRILDIKDELDLLISQAKASPDDENYFRYWWEKLSGLSLEDREILSSLYRDEWRKQLPEIPDGPCDSITF